MVPKAQGWETGMTLRSMATVESMAVGRVLNTTQQKLWVLVPGYSTQPQEATVSSGHRLRNNWQPGQTWGLGLPAE